LHAASEGIEVMTVGTAEADGELLRRIISVRLAMASVADPDTVLPEMVATVGATQ
jgi:hypothetical protein